MGGTWGPGLVSMGGTWGPGLVSTGGTWGPGLVGSIVAFASLGLFDLWSLHRRRRLQECVERLVGDLTHLVQRHRVLLELIGEIGHHQARGQLRID